MSSTWALALLGPEVEDVPDDREEVLGADVHGRLLGDFHVELPVDAEAADLAQAVAVLVEELLVEELLGLVHLRRVARPEAAVDLQKRGLVS